ncbi:MAG TPA: hypothetical protein VNP72_04010 [Longimicrobium sp.]|nr:hypothetical protein [Longimicrobium sp.]
MSRAKSKRSRRSPRPWAIPPGLLVLQEPFEGYQVLEETQNETGVLLWQSLRDVELWTAAEPRERAVLFADGALHARQAWIEEQVQDGAMRRILESLAVVLERPETLTATEVADLCEEVSTWASDSGLPRTALAFAQRCAVAAPEAAGAAYLVALLARRNADYKRADTWFRRCLALARRHKDWKHYGLAQIGIANLHMQRGDGPSARARLMQALRAARRHALWGVRAPAFHDLFCIAATSGDIQEAEMYAKAAYRSYGRRHPKLPALAHDVARFWMQQKHYRTALAVFRAVLGPIHRPPERLLVLSSIAQAAAGAGEVLMFEQAWYEVWEVVEASDDRERVAEALINLARAAALLGERRRVERAASQALGIALRRGEAQERIAAEALLGTGWETRAPHGEASAEDTPVRSASTARLARELVVALDDF